MNLRELKQFLDQISGNENAYWESIFRSDMRNIFPKYEVCKIQTMKNQISKVRLIMENINNFMQMAASKSSLKSNVVSISQNISEEVGDLFKECKNKNYHYNADILSKKDIVDKIAKQFTKPIHLSLLKNVKSSQKWKQYIQTHMQQPTQLSLSDMDEERISIAKTFPVFGTDVQNAQHQFIQNQLDNLNFEYILKFGCGLQGKLYEKRIKQKMMVNRLVDYLYEQKGINQTCEAQQKQAEFADKQFERIKKIYNI